MSGVSSTNALTTDTSIPIHYTVNQGGGVAGLTITARLIRSDDGFFYNHTTNLYQAGLPVIGDSLPVPGVGALAGLYRAIFNATLFGGTHPPKLAVVYDITGTITAIGGPDEIVFTDIADPLPRLHALENWQVHGLDIANPMVVDAATPAGSRQVPAGGTEIDQNTVTAGDVTTITRV